MLAYNQIHRIAIYKPLTITMQLTVMASSKLLLTNDYL